MLKERRNQTAGYLSGGEQQMLVIGRALMSDPKVILLDEPSLGLAPMIIENIFGVIRRLRDEQKITVLLVEQNAALALDIADHGYVMENGRIVLEGPADSCARTPTSRSFISASTRPAPANPTARPRTTAGARGGCRSGCWLRSRPVTLICRFAVADGVPRRALWVAVVVGTVLNLINQGDAIVPAAPSTS